MKNPPLEPELKDTNPDLPVLKVPLEVTSNLQKKPNNRKNQKNLKTKKMNPYKKNKKKKPNLVNNNKDPP